MSRYFKKQSYFSDEIMFVAKLDEDEVTFVGDDSIDITADPDDNYGSVGYFREHKYFETTEDEYNRFLKNTKIWQQLETYRD